MGVLGAVLVLATCLALFLLCLKFRHLCTYFIRWLPSNREEKAVLTRLKGHYNANGYLVGSDSDIRLDWTGSFRRFESVDSEGALLGAKPPSPIPPQPLRPAPEIAGAHSIPQPSSHNQSTSQDVDVPDPSEGVPVLGRAISCDSVSSVTSIVAQDLVEPNIAGYLCIGIDYDSECGDLLVNVIEAKDLVCRDYPVSPDGLMDTFVSVYLLPTRTTDMQTRTYRSSRSPSYKEKFLFGLEVTDFCRSSVMFQVYGAKREGNTLLGQANLHLADVPTRQPITTWLTLHHTETKENALGEILFSLSYLPTAERLTVVIIRARNLKFSQTTADPYVKVYLLKNGKKVHKKRTQTKKNDASPIFNEAMMFNVPNSVLQSVELRVTVAENDTGEVVGHVIVGCHVGGKALSHWSQMIASLRKPVAMWHPLLRPSVPLISPTRPEPAFTFQR